jgi:hypothetical protein
VVACGLEGDSLLDLVPAGIAENDSEIYVLYQRGSATAIARVSP